MTNTQTENADTLRSKYAEKQARKRVSSKQDNSTEVKIEDRIKNTPAKHSALSALKYRVSHRIETAAKLEQQNALCSDTGIVISLNIPRIPGFVFSYTSPFSEPTNCRLVAQRGFSYLNKLDTQILAGILLSLADSYNLFVFSPSAGGAEKNAILRTAGKLQVINAILFLEEKIHSGNYYKLPKLSFLIDSHLTQGEVESRLLQYLKLCVTYLVAPLPEPVYSETDAPKKTITPEYSSKAKKLAELEAKNARVAERNLKAALADAAKNTKSLFKESLIKIKLRDVLINTLTMEMFPLIPMALKNKAIERLSELGQNARAIQIITTLKMTGKVEVELDDFDSSPTVTSNTPVSSFPVLPKTVESLQDYWDSYDGKINSDADFFATLPTNVIINETSSVAFTVRDDTFTPLETTVEATSEASEVVECITIYSPKGSFIVPSSLWNELNSIQRIAYKKKMLG